MWFADPIAQFFGLVSFVIATLCYMQKDDLKFKYFMLALNVVHTLHYVLLDALTSAVCTAIAIARTYSSIKTNSKQLAYFFILLVVGINAIFIVENWFDWFSVAGSVLGTYAMFCLTGVKMRLFFLLGSTCWLINNIIVNSIGGIMLETLAIVVNINTIWRMSSSEQSEVQTTKSIQQLNMKST
ncbi:YgjV family protein (plasmid) [Saccharobesus litoralis]|uniref:YgjV family protein n=1 Tax=Saccharobesus litoralis TaxID=2172099 RepID=A0A2S0VYB4_9ALTE|nr:YgjV family protein [Saccharobesus litoralis]AWB69209.1 YgjV family protein [Saccharobesus litoralis]